MSAFFIVIPKPPLLAVVIVCHFQTSAYQNQYHPSTSTFHNLASKEVFMIIFSKKTMSCDGFLFW